MTFLSAVYSPFSLGRTEMLKLWSDREAILSDAFQFDSYCSVQSYVICGIINTLQPSGHYTYSQFNIQQFYVLSTHRIYVFCVDLRTNSEYFPIQH